MKLLTTCSFLFVFVLGALAQQELKGKVVEVIDGNTISVLFPSGERTTYLLAGIDSPELGQEFGDQSRKLLEKLILNKEVSLTTQGKDRKGVWIALVLTEDNKDPRVELLRQGLAWTAERNPDQELEAYRKFAMEKGKGLWKQDNPVPPWMFRRNQSMMTAKSS